MDRVGSILVLGCFAFPLKSDAVGRRLDDSVFDSVQGEMGTSSFNASRDIFSALLLANLPLNKPRKTSRTVVRMAGTADGVSLERKEAAARKASIQVCTNTDCKGNGGSLALLRRLASTHTGIKDMIPEAVRSQKPAASFQNDFAMQRVKEVGCMGKCPLGPNVRDDRDGISMINGVFGPIRSVNALETIGFKVPDVALAACISCEDAKEKLRSYRATGDKADLQQAQSKMTQALTMAGKLKLDAVALCVYMLEKRAEIQKAKGDEAAAQKDLDQSAKLAQMTY